MMRALTHKFCLTLILAAGILGTLSGEDHEREHEHERHNGKEGRSGGKSGRTVYKEIPAAVTRAVSYTADVKPILVENCTRCHGAKKHKGDLRLDTQQGIMAGSEEGPIVKPGNGEGSLLVRSIAGVKVESDQIMPPKEDLLSKEDIGIIRAWIDQGAKFDGK